MKHIARVCCFLFMLHHVSAHGQQAIDYGNNNEAGTFVKVNGVNLYYEIYGKGEPLLLIHASSKGITGMKPQIEYFAKHYKVIAIDNRGRGKSELGKDSLSYLQATKDIAAVLEHLKTDSVIAVGKSDGAIIGLMLGMYYPKQVKKIAAFGANLWPDSTALIPETVKAIKAERRLADNMLAKKDTTKNWRLQQQLNRMMEFQPNITAQDLQKIKVPVLVMSCDRDLIQTEHTLFIYKNIPMASLCILPGENHYLPRTNPGLFNSTIAKFLSEPYKDYSYRFKK